MRFSNSSTVSDFLSLVIFQSLKQFCKIFVVNNIGIAVTFELTWVKLTLRRHVWFWWSFIFFAICHGLFVGLGCGFEICSWLDQILVDELFRDNIFPSSRDHFF